MPSAICLAFCFHLKEWKYPVLSAFLYLDGVFTSIIYLVAEGIFNWAEMGVDKGAGDDAAVGEEADVAVGVLAEVVEELCYAVTLVLVAFGSSGREMDPVLIPELQGGIGDFVPFLHFPGSEMEFFEAVVADGGRKMAESGQLQAAAEGTTVYGIEMFVGKAGCDKGSFLREGGS